MALLLIHLHLLQILPLLDDLGIARKLRSDRVEFTTRMFIQFDHNDDGVLRHENSPLHPNIAHCIAHVRAC